MESILVTGGAGYIGSHAVFELVTQGYDVVVVDSLENGCLDFVDKRAKFYKGNIQDISLLEKIFTENNICIVMHFAAYIKVPESMTDPNKYYKNNIYSTLCLLDVMVKHNVKNLIFSSTAAVYGEVKGDRKVIEEMECNPMNPYGMSKWVMEKIIQDNAKAYGMHYAIFRYFNVAGANENGKIGQIDSNVTSLIPNILKSIWDDKSKFTIFGNDYNTIDGTGVRDFIHVVDLVKAHILAIPFLLSKNSGIFNLGSQRGYSVLEILKNVEKVTGKKIIYSVLPRREGDPACVLASNERAKSILGWSPKYCLDDIIRTSWKWKQNLEKGLIQSDANKTNI